MGGDHKCPLCSATFTRPQHVGRHLRAHTGDRPYECKECPLRFARSDLLSRHVNKAHRAPEDSGGGGAAKKEGKKGRRKSSVGSLANGDGADHDEASNADLRRASVDLAHSTPTQNAQSQLEASKLYPHHPLLSNSPQAQRPLQTWNIMENAPFSQTPYAGSGNMGLQGAYAGGFPPSYSNLFTATPMRQSGSEQGMGAGANAFSRSPPMNPWAAYDFGFKKKACDQCNHSKVRCDFADPCARCSHRNIMCTYNKPSKSRSIVQAMPFGNRLGVFESSSNGSNSSLSPQSQISTSPLHRSPTALPAPTPQQRRQSLSGGMLNNAAMSMWNSSYPPAGAPIGNSIMSQPMWTQSMSDLNAMLDPHLMAPPIAQPMPVAHQHTPMQAYARGESAHLTQSTLPIPPTTLPNGLISHGFNSSPSATLAPTPALTNDSRSPSGASEPSEPRRNSRANTVLGNGIEPMTVLPRKLSIASEQPTSMPMTYSPASATASARNSFDVGNPALTNDGGLVWPPAPTINMVDPRLHFRNSTSITDDDSASVPGSSAASIYLEPLEGMDRLAERRFSTGAWASAFNNMSLQDANGNPTSISVDALTDPMSAGRVMQTLSARRPTFPLTLQASDGTETKIPSMADVKDLWKLFMSEPITGPTPALDVTTPAANGNGSALVTPRPGMGHRTLSKTNSMPDLNSPTHSQAINSFFVHSGITPKPVEGQTSYMPAQLPSDTLLPKPDANIRKWKEEINSRQAAFTMQPGQRFGGKVASPPESGNMPPTHSMDYAALSNMPVGASLSGNRPLASVLQANPALYQTLAPERAPSYNFGNSYEDTIPTLKVNSASPGYITPAIVTSKFTSNLSGPAITSVSNLGANATESAMPNLAARPGNKRLASQTLVHEKKTSFSLYDGEGFGEEDATGVDVLPGMDPSILGTWTPVGAGVPLQNAP